MSLTIGVFAGGTSNKVANHPEIIQADLAVATDVDKELALLNGMITNDKFCCTRWSELHLSWWRRPMRLRS